MPTQVSLLDGALASAGTLAIQTNGTTSAITISSAQVATFVNNPIMTGLTASRAVFTDGSKGLTSNAITGTGNVVMSASPTLTGTIDGAALTLSSSLTLSGGTANGVLYLNGSKVATSGSALTFDGTNLGVGVTPTYPLDVSRGSSGVVARFASTSGAGAFVYADSSQVYYGAASGVPNCFVINNGSNYVALNANGSEGARLTSTGLGIGTSSPSYKLHVNGYVYSGSGFVLLSQASGGGNIFEASGNTGIDFGTTSNTLSFTTSGSTRMRLDSSGNLGIGTSSPLAKLDVNGQIVAQNGSTSSLGYAFRLALSSGMYLYDDGVGANVVLQANANNNQLYLQRTGNVGIGTSSPSYKLDVSAAKNTTNIKLTSTGLDSADDYTQLSFGDASNIYGAVRLGYNNPAVTSASYLAFYNNTGSSTTERMRLDSSGNLLINKTTATTTGAGGYILASGQVSGTRDGGAAGAFRRDTSDGDVVIFLRGGTQVGSVSVTTTATAYNTSSDYRLKENIQPMTGALAKVQALKPCTYNWKADGSDGEGFIAHELAEIVPQAVTGQKDAVDADGNPVYQGIDTSFLVATLTAAIQELKAEFDAYKATHP